MSDNNLSSSLVAYIFLTGTVLEVCHRPKFAHRGGHANFSLRQEPFLQIAALSGVGEVVVLKKPRA